MKNLATSLFILLAFLCPRVHAQMADGITYQAVAVDVNGKEIAGMDINGSVIYDKEIGVRFSVIAGSGEGEVQYCEEHSTFTDQNGLFTLVIGHGEVSSSGKYQKLADIQWGADRMFLKVEIKTYRSSTYVLTGVQQMMAVPFAFYALRSAGMAVDYSDILNRPTLSAVATSGSYNDLSGKPQLSPLAASGSFKDLVDIPPLATVAASGSFRDLVDIPPLAAVAASGNYNDLLNGPALAPVAISGSYNDLVNRPSLSAVATSGDFDDLNDTPDLSDVAYSGDYDDLVNLPHLAPVAVSGAYQDLSGRPSFSSVATSGDYYDLRNRPSLFDGNYNSLTNKPSSFRETTDEFSSSSGQTSFTLRNTPASTSVPRMFINGIRISNQAYRLSGTAVTYIPGNNGSYSLVSGDRIQFDYSY